MLWLLLILIGVTAIAASLAAWEEVHRAKWLRFLAAVGAFIGTVVVWIILLWFLTGVCGFAAPWVALLPQVGPVVVKPVDKPIVIVDESICTPKPVPAYNKDKEYVVYLPDSCRWEIRDLPALTAPVVAPPKDTPVPPTITSTLTPAPAGSEPQGLKYQFDAGCDKTSTPLEYPACILQRVQSGEMTGEQAVVAIQALGQKFSAPSFEGMVLSLPNTQPAVVWCPAGVAYFPPDTARPLEGTKGAQWANLLFVIDKATGGPDRKIEAKNSPCWMVYVK